MVQKDIQVIVDTREQTPLFFSKCIHKKLDVGDYSIEGYEGKIAIERKTLSDLFGTLSGGIKRFLEEIKRAKEYDYFAIVTIASFTQILEGTEYSQKKGITILRTLFTLQMKYGVKIFFCNNEVEATMLINMLFESFLKRKEAEINEELRNKDSITTCSDISNS